MRYCRSAIFFLSRRVSIRCRTICFLFRSSRACIFEFNSTTDPLITQYSGPTLWLCCASIDLTHRMTHRRTGDAEGATNQIHPSEFAILLMWLTAARPFRFRFVLALIAAYLTALVLAVPGWLLLPLAMLPGSVLPESWPSLPPLVFAPTWIACSAVGLSTWFVLSLTRACRR